MVVKQIPPINTQGAERKRSRQPHVPPCQRFSQVMVSKKPDKRDKKKPSIFDIAQKKQETDHAPQHGTIQKLLENTSSEEILSTLSLSELTPEMTHLVEKMANFVLIESQNGIRTTTVILNMEGSSLDGTHLIMDHYDTAPHSFNLELSGSPENIDLFSAQLAMLKSALETNPKLQGMVVHEISLTLNEYSFKNQKEKESALSKGKEARIPSGKKSLPKLN